MKEMQIKKQPTQSFILGLEYHQGSYIIFLLVVFFSLFIFQAGWAQSSSGKVTGVVTDNEGNPIPGATVMVEGTTVGTITATDGTYNLANVNMGQVLVFSYIGMQAEKITYSNQDRIDVVLKLDLYWLNEFVVVGYGTMRRSDLTGSVASVTSEDLNRFPAANLTEMLRGQAPGIHVTTADASPGGASSIRIRGNRSLSSSQAPLIIVDGMPVPHTNDLNATDIESVEILKDASSQAIYGSRAANGVILITTKRGEAGKVDVNLNSYVGFQQFTRNFELYTPEEWVKLRFWAKYNDGQAGIGEPDDINYQAVIDDDVMYNAWQTGQFTNWEELMLGNAVQQKHDISIRGGSETLKYASAFGLLNQDGVVKNSGYTRANFRLNTDFIVSNWFDFGTNIALSRSTRETTDGSFNQFITRPPLGLPFHNNGSITREVSSAGDINPLWRIENYDREIKDEYVNLSTFANIKPFKGFNYRVGASLRSNNRETGFYRTKDYPGSTGDGSVSNWNRYSWLIDNVITYNLPLNPDLHNITLTLIQSIEKDNQTTTGFDFINSTTDIFGWNVAADSEVSSTTRSIIRTSAVSYAARLHYSLLNRYLFTASFRRDGASVFGKENKWGNFPSAAFGWRISEEGFLSDLHWLNLLRLRVSYGVVGNWAIPPYRTLGLANSFEYLFGTSLQIGYLPGSQLLNPNLKWETTSSFNTGIDFSAFDGRINAVAEYYQTSTIDLLVQRTIPSITGYNVMWDNLGETESNGWEFSVDGWVVDKQGFSLQLGASLSTQSNRIVKIDGRVDEEGIPIDDINNRWFIGESINVSYHYLFNGIWQEDEIANITEDDYLPGDAAPTAGSIRLADHNGDGMITTDDRKIFNLDPKWYGSFNINVLFKGFDLVLDFYTVQQVQRNNIYLFSFDAGGSLNGKLQGMKVNYWTPENQSQEAPKPQFTAAVPYFETLGMQDASYFRLRLLTFGYTLPQSITRSIGIDKARLYFTGTNLFTQTKFQSYGPESSPGSYPEAQIFTFGVNMGF